MHGLMIMLHMVMQPAGKLVIFITFWALVHFNTGVEGDSRPPHHGAAVRIAVRLDIFFQRNLA